MKLFNSISHIECKSQKDWMKNKKMQNSATAPLSCHNPVQK